MPLQYIWTTVQEQARFLFMNTVCMHDHVCFNLLSDNESNIIRVVWYFVMLYNCLVSFQP